MHINRPHLPNIYSAHDMLSVQPLAQSRESYLEFTVLPTLWHWEFARVDLRKDITAQIGESLQHPPTNGVLVLHGLLADELPPHIGNLQGVRQLTLTNMPNLTRLPAQIRNMAELEKIVVINCPQLEGLPDEVCELPNLAELLLSELPALEQLPAAIGSLPKLNGVLLMDLRQLREIPPSLSQSTTLANVALINLPRLSPESFQSLQAPNLKELTINACNVTKLPENFELGEEVSVLCLADNLLERVPQQCLTRDARVNLTGNPISQQQKYLSQSFERDRVSQWSRGDHVGPIIVFEDGLNFSERMFNRDAALRVRVAWEQEIGGHNTPALAMLQSSICENALSEFSGTAQERNWKCVMYAATQNTLAQWNAEAAAQGLQISGPCLDVIRNLVDAFAPEPAQSAEEAVPAVAYGPTFPMRF